MKRVLLFTTLVVVLVGLMAGTALAGGWWTSGTNPWDNSSNTNYKYSSASFGGQQELYGYTGTGLAQGYALDTMGATTANGGSGKPHGGFAATTSFCKTCHAVHNADEDSWRLLRGATTVATQVNGGKWSMGFSGDESTYTAGNTYDGNYSGYQTARGDNSGNAGFARAGECDVCHLGTNSLSKKRQYKLPAANVRAEHTLGALVIPDSSETTSFASSGAAFKSYGENAGLQCYTCHTVHGGNRLGVYPAGDPSGGAAGNEMVDGAGATAGWGDKILRNDPNRDGHSAGGTAGGANEEAKVLADAEILASGNATNTFQYTRTTYCADCHNKNWRNPLNGSGGANAWVDPDQTHPAWKDSTPNTMEVYGDATVTVAWAGVGATSATDKFKGCRACHRASSQYSSSNTGPSIWPHQGIGYKFLTDAYTNVTGVLDAGGNSITAGGLDTVCLGCHNSAINGTSDGASGVGKTF